MLTISDIITRFTISVLTAIVLLKTGITNHLVDDGDDIIPVNRSLNI